MLNELFHEIIPVALRHEDLNCMHYSIENRSPFLDSDLFKFANTIPTKYMIQNGFQKLASFGPSLAASRPPCYL